MFMSSKSMQWNTVPKSKVIVVGDEDLDLNEEMVVQFGCFINYPKLGDPAVAELRISIVKKVEEVVREAERLYVHRFDSLPLKAITGDVVVPAQELIRLRSQDERPSGYREIALSVILHSEIQTLQFNISKAKATCEIWFGCARERPISIIPKAELGKFFDPIPY